jgi:hypothetical protein
MIWTEIWLRIVAWVWKRILIWLSIEAWIW